MHAVVVVVVMSRTNTHVLVVVVKVRTDSYVMAVVVVRVDLARCCFQ